MFQDPNYPDAADGQDWPEEDVEYEGEPEYDCIVHGSRGCACDIEPDDWWDREAHEPLDDLDW